MIVTKCNNEINPQEVRYFGNEVSKKYTQDGRFKSFDINSWIKTHDGKKYYVDITIRKLKKKFNNYDSSKQKITEYKKGKEKTAFQWTCEVIEEGTTIKLNEEHLEIVKKAVEEQKPFTLDNTYIFYKIKDRHFKDTRHDQYIYADLEDGRLVQIDFSEIK